MCTLDSIATLPRKITFTLNIYALSTDDIMGIRIMKLRKAKCLTAKELSELSGLTLGAILNYENGNAYPSRSVFLKFIDILGKDVLCDDYSKFITSAYGPIIKKWRKDNKLSCDQVADYIGVSPRMLYSLENMEYIL